MAGHIGSLFQYVLSTADSVHGIYLDARARRESHGELPHFYPSEGGPETSEADRTENEQETGYTLDMYAEAQYGTVIDAISGVVCADVVETPTDTDTHPDVQPQTSRQPRQIET